MIPVLVASQDQGSKLRAWFNSARLVSPVLHLFIYTCISKICVHFPFLSILRWHRLWKSFLMEGKGHTTHDVFCFAQRSCCIVRLSIRSLVVASNGTCLQKVSQATRSHLSCLANASHHENFYAFTRPRIRLDLADSINTIIHRKFIGLMCFVSCGPRTCKFRGDCSG